MRPYTQHRSRRAHPKQCVSPRRRRRRRLVLRSKRRPVAQPAYLASTRSDFPADGADEEPASRTKCKCPPHFTERFLLSSPTASSVVRSDRFSAFVRRNPRSRSSGTSVPGDIAVPPRMPRDIATSQNYSPRRTNVLHDSSALQNLFLLFYSRPVGCRKFRNMASLMPRFYNCLGRLRYLVFYIGGRLSIMNERVTAFTFCSPGSPVTRFQHSALSGFVLETASIYTHCAMQYAVWIYLFRHRPTSSAKMGCR